MSFFRTISLPSLGRVKTPPVNAPTRGLSRSPTTPPDRERELVLLDERAERRAIDSARMFYASHGASPHSAGAPWPLEPVVMAKITNMNDASIGSAWSFEGVAPRDQENRHDPVVMHVGPDEDAPPGSEGFYKHQILRFPFVQRTAERERDTWTVLSEMPMFKIPGEPRFFYYEVTICEIHPLTRLSVGLATKPYPYMRLPGIEVNSIAHTGDDGFLHINGSGSKWSAPYAPGRAGATIGCGVSLDANGCPAGVFFTREGVLIAADGFGRAQTLDAAVVGRYSPLMSKQLHVACGATGRAILAFNFGHLPFTWEIANAHMDFGFSTPEFGLPTYDVAMLDGDQTLSGLPAYSA